MRIKPTFHKNLFHELGAHKFAYTVLVIFLSAVAAGFAWAGYNPLWQRIFILTLGLGYFLWGMFTHVSASHLTTRLIFEYAAISILASVCLIALTI